MPRPNSTNLTVLESTCERIDQLLEKAAKKDSSFDMSRTRFVEKILNQLLDAVLSPSPIDIPILIHLRKIFGKDVDDSPSKGKLASITEILRKHEELIADLNEQIRHRKK